MTALNSKVADSFEFGPFVLIPGQHLLLERGQPVRIGRRAFDLLAELVKRPGEIVTKRELLARVWPGLVVEEANLKVTVAAIRRILGENQDAPDYIATVVGRGYRFIASVQGGGLPRPASSCTVRGPSGALPSCTLPIFGRDALIRWILSDLQHGRLVSIVGPGGAGKTTVAVAVAAQAAGTHKGRTRFVDLSLVEDAAQVPVAIAGVFSSCSAAADGAVELPGGRHGDTDLLLILDNCEHLVAPVAQWVDHMLARTRRLKVIITSREPICIREERVRRLHGLDLPPEGKAIAAAEALAFPAVQLFAARVAVHLKSFRIDDANASIVTEICRRLDGLALAIERVAPRVGALGVNGMLNHLERRFHMFDGYHEGPERHRTLTAAIESSYSLLSPSEQATLLRLSAHPGPFSLEEACLLGAAPGVDAAAVTDDIAQLVSKSLLSADSRDGQMQYRQAHLTRAFAMERRIRDNDEP